MPKKLPYGMSNFADLIENGYAYVDKTRFIGLLEDENNRFQFFIRPRRFGKSLFLTMLENYYDLSRKDKFDSIFGDLYIGKNPTSERGMYAVLQFDFSGLDEDEVTEGYVDIYLQRHPVIPDIKYEYVFETKYIKANASETDKEVKFAEAQAQIEKYKKDLRFANRADIKFVAIVFEGKGEYEVREV